MKDARYRTFGLRKSIDIGSTKHRNRHSSSVVCLECGKEFISLPQHIGQVHCPTIKYLEKYHLNKEDLYADGILERIRTVSRAVGISKEAVEARKRYWADESHHEEKAVFMRDEMIQRKKEGFYNTPSQKKSQRKFIKMRQEAHKIQMKLRNTCGVCGRVFSIQDLLNEGQIKDSRNVTGRFTKIKLCSRECRNKNISRIRKEYWENKK